VGTTSRFTASVYYRRLSATAGVRFHRRCPVFAVLFFFMFFFMVSMLLFRITVTERNEREVAELPERARDLEAL
jgi:uncharacterized membrane protein